MEVVLPENLPLPGWKSELVPEAAVVTNALPKDTSFGQRRYTRADGFWSVMNVVLMGTDRTSIHKPQICLVGQGWQNNQSATRVEPVHIEKPFAYDLPVMRMVGTLNTVDAQGNPITVSGIYAYWFVDAKQTTAQHWERMWWMARDVLLTGELDRWAYVTVFSVCAPGQEEATFAQMKQLIAATVPEFQRVPQAGK